MTCQDPSRRTRARTCSRCCSRASRSVSLPADADEKHVEAVYDKGVLEVTVSLEEKADEKPQRRIPVMLNKHINPT